jgi:uncharacterized tellurite resistance protein B-like protein
MSVIFRLRDLLRPRSSDASGLPVTDRHLTVAVLLSLVAHVDGRVSAAETEGLRRLLGSRFGLTEAQTDLLLKQVEEIGSTMDSSTTLVSRILQDIAPEGLPGLLELAYQVAALDGVVHDFEDDFIWRTGRLLGLGDDALAAIKAGALGAPLQDQPHG